MQTLTVATNEDGIEELDWRTLLENDEPLHAHEFASEDMRSFRSSTSQALAYSTKYTPIQARAEVFPDWVLNNPDFCRLRILDEGRGAADIFKTPAAERTIPQTAQIIEWLQKTWRVAHKIGVKRCAHVVRLLHYSVVKAGTKIFREGDLGDEFYIILSGSVAVRKQSLGKVASLGPGHSFGELALTVHTAGRTATCVAEEDCELLTLNKRDYEHFALDIQYADRREALVCLTQCPLFTGWKRTRIEEVCNICHRKLFVKGEYIYRQNDDPDCLYVILEGQVEVIREVEVISTNRWPIGINEWHETVSKKIKFVRQRTLSKNQCFGELAIIRSSKRQTSVRARCDISVLAIDKNEFTYMLRPDKYELGFENVRILAEDGSYEDEVVLHALDNMLSNMGQNLPPLKYTYTDMYAWAHDTPKQPNSPSSSQQPVPVAPTEESQLHLGPAPAHSSLPAKTQALDRRRGRRLSTVQRYLLNFQAKLFTTTLPAPSPSTLSSAEPAADEAEQIDAFHVAPNAQRAVVHRTLKRVRTAPSLGVDVRQAKTMDRPQTANAPKATPARTHSKRNKQYLSNKTEHMRGFIAQGLQDDFYTKRLGNSNNMNQHRQAMMAVSPGLNGRKIAPIRMTSA